MTQEELNKKKTDIKNSISKQQEKLKEITTDIETKTKRLEEISVPDAAPSQEVVDISNYIEEQKKTKATIEEAISADQQKLKEYETIQPTESSDSNQSSNTGTMSQSDKEKNAKLAAEHPERVVDGIYYADDDALASAKEAYEKKVQEETKRATAEATANANKLAAAMKKINETLYGTDNQEVIEQLQGTVGGAELSSILGNAVDVRARQKLLDFKKFKSDFKSSNAGKRQNNIVQRYVTNPNKRQSYVFNYNVFSTIDSEAKAYWLGFLMADAYVDQDSVELCIKAEDVEHLKLFRSLFQGIVPEIKYKVSANAYRLLLCSVELCKDLADKGCIHGKLLRTFPDKDKMPKTLIHHFMRGYFDGDGSIYIDKHNNLRFSVIGSSHFLDRYENILISHCDNKNIPRRRFQSKTGVDCQEIRYSGNKRCADIYHFLYHKATIYLQRKKVNFDIVFMPS